MRKTRLLLHGMGCICCFIFAIVSFYIPWIQIDIPVKSGSYKVNVPAELGLLKCFGGICKNPDSFLQLHPLIGTIRLPKRSPQIPDNPPVFPPEPEKPTVDKHELHERIKPIKTASTVTICVMVVADLLNFLLFVIMMENIISQTTLQNEESLMLQNEVLLATIFCNFLSACIYILLTCVHLNGGHYIDGIWLACYSIMISLLCCIGSSVVGKESREKEQQQQTTLHEINRNYNHNNYDSINQYPDFIDMENLSLLREVKFINRSDRVRRDSHSTDTPTTSWTTGLDIGLAIE